MQPLLTPRETGFGPSSSGGALGLMCSQMEDEMQKISNGLSAIDFLSQKESTECYLQVVTTILDCAVCRLPLDYQGYCRSLINLVIRGWPRSFDEKDFEYIKMYSLLNSLESCGIRNDVRSYLYAINNAMFLRYERSLSRCNNLLKLTIEVIIRENLISILNQDELIDELKKNGICGRYFV
jgi:hypothetical protein